MRLYRVIGAGWAGTLADAKAAAKEAGATWYECDVPTDKPGLLAFLNDRNVPGTAEEGAAAASAKLSLSLVAEEPPASDPFVMAIAADERSPSFTSSAIEDFILNRATVAQVENIFATLGSRFAEQRSVAA